MRTLIKPVVNSYKKDQRQQVLEYFFKRSSKEPLMDYEKLAEHIQNAQEYICIASTSAIHNSLLKQVIASKPKGVRLYIVLKDFDEARETLDFFGEVNPACIRQVKGLDNNFIIVDGEISFLMLNSLQRDKNICVQFEGSYSQDLYHIFNDYFWNRADEQCLLSVRTKELTSPFPPFELSLKHIAYRERTESYDANIVPCDEKTYKTFKSSAHALYMSPYIESPVSLKGSKSYLGQFVVDESLFEDIKPEWKLKEDTLEKAYETGQEVIPFEMSWSQPKQIEELVKKELASVEAATVEAMPNSAYETYPNVPCACEVEYTWLVTPPQKPENVKKAVLYKEFEGLKAKFEADCVTLKHRLEETERLHEASRLSSFFSGASHQLKVLNKELSGASKQDIEKFTIYELEDFLKKEFKELFEGINTFCSNHENHLKEKEQQEKWNQEKKKKENELEMKEGKLKDALRRADENKKLIERVKSLEEKIKDKKLDSEKIKSIQEERLNLDKKTVGLKSLEKEYKQLEREVKSIKQDIERKYSRFVYRPPVSPLHHLKHQDSKLEWENYKLPSFALPEVGILFENKQSYFLEIQYTEDLECANKLCQRYKKEEKEAKVVVKDC